jgi:hypothetical protein
MGYILVTSCKRTLIQTAHVGPDYLENQAKDRKTTTTNQQEQMKIEYD